MASYLSRLIDAELAVLFEDLPAVSIVGPRACGKTTSANKLTKNVVHLDQEDIAEVFIDDPDAALRAVGEPVLLDEWQMAPQVLGAIKRAVDSGEGNSRFALTGSASALLNISQWPGTGRVVDVTMYPMTVRERLGRVGARSIIERLAQPSTENLAPADNWAQSPDLAGYLRMACDSGFPEAIKTSERSRRAWFQGYVNHLMSRDAPLLNLDVDMARFARFVEATAILSGTVSSDQTVSEAAGVSRATAVTYERLLQQMYISQPIPAWESNRISRLVKSSKRMLVDAGLMAAILQVDVRGIMLDSRLLGQIVETFVVSQLRPEIEVSVIRPSIYHLREANNRREIDLILEYPGRRIVAIEVKASGSVGASDVRHLRWVKDKLGDNFVAGVVLYTGAITRKLDERIFAAPISTIWADI